MTDIDIGNCHGQCGKAIVLMEQARAIVQEVCDRDGQTSVNNNMDNPYISLQNAVRYNVAEAGA